MIELLIGIALGIIGAFGIPFLIKFYYWRTFLPSGKDVFFDIRARNERKMPVISTEKFSLTMRHKDLEKYDGILEIKNVSERKILIEEVTLLFPNASYEDLFRIGTSSSSDLFPEMSYETRNDKKYCKHAISLDEVIEPKKGKLRNVTLPKPPTSKTDFEVKSGRGDVNISSPKLESPVSFLLMLKCKFIETDWMQLLNFRSKSVKIERKFTI
ncbi:hypothetical protein AKJ43_01935 [candidate division MSBL1 archaeon SCGC-AAA261D19]|uniref:Uncharacterized protein n=1 Tax=candidate division MSBL1 archaeon SCGC-AAA261D19 TaxID=1698273 RepID=A0A133V7E4_9EURY|nr:hypothetical protein AKJ43_01935 [candidate division MSBL1 archaeon SCGC-AAA261D19]